MLKKEGSLHKGDHSSPLVPLPVLEILESLKEAHLDQIHTSVSHTVLSQEKPGVVTKQLKR